MSNKNIKLWKTLKVVSTKRINGIPYKRINIYNPITLCVVFFGFFKGLFYVVKNELKNIHKEFEWKRDYLQEYEDRRSVKEHENINNGTNIDK